MASTTDQPPLDPGGDSEPEQEPNVGQDPFDPSRLRLSQNFAEMVGVKKALLTVPVRKPNRQDFIRVHASPDYRLETAVLELKDERESYLVDPALYSELPGEIAPKVLFTVINRQGVLMLWPIRLPGEDGRHDEWNRSALEAAQMAQSRWVRVAANLYLGAYEVYEAVADLPEPEWPEVSFQEILMIAFKARFITDLPSRHPPPAGRVVMKVGGMHFREVWVADFEFFAPPGERPTPICLVAWELARARSSICGKTS